MFNILKTTLNTKTRSSGKINVEYYYDVERTLKCTTRSHICQVSGLKAPCSASFLPKLFHID